MTSPRRTGESLTGWIDEPWAYRGQSRSVFFQNVLVRFCPTFINPILSRATQEVITIGYDFWSDAGVSNSIYRTFASLLAFDWCIVAFIASQDSVFVRRLNRQSSHEFHRAKQFLENFSSFCEYRNMKLGQSSERFGVSCLHSLFPHTLFSFVGMHPLPVSTFLT